MIWGIARSRSARGQSKEEAALVTHVRKVVGDDMTLAGSACELRTFADALYVGRACDEAIFLVRRSISRLWRIRIWASKTTGNAKNTHLETEHIRGVEPKADFAIAGGTDFLRSDQKWASRDA